MCCVRVVCACMCVCVRACMDACMHTTLHVEIIPTNVVYTVKYILVDVTYVNDDGWVSDT